MTAVTRVTLLSVASGPIPRAAPIDGAWATRLVASEPMPSASPWECRIGSSKLRAVIRLRLPRAEMLPTAETAKSYSRGASGDEHSSRRSVVGANEGGVVVAGEVAVDEEGPALISDQTPWPPRMGPQHAK